EGRGAWGRCRSFSLQAEDGIRDGHVTGVQTCALPVWDRRWTGDEGQKAEPLQPEGRALLRVALSRVVGEKADVPHGRHERSSDEIGRASCRERVWLSAEPITWKRNG